MKHLSPEQISSLVAGIHIPEAAHARECIACSQEVEQAQKVLTLFGGSVREWANRQVYSERSVQTSIPSSSKRSQGTRRAPMAWVLAAVTLTAAVAIPAYQDFREREIHAEALQNEQLLRDQQLLNAVNAQLSRNGPLAMDPLMLLMSVPEGGSRKNSTESESGGEQ